MSRRVNKSKRKIQVEESLPLDARRLLRRRFLQPGKVGRMSWPLSYPLREASAQVEYSGTFDSPIVTLRYGFDHSSLWPTENPDAGDYQRGSYTIKTTRTRQRLGACRHWLVCGGCSRRVRLLYLPQGARQFKCRHCHALVYRSAQEWKTKLAAVRQKFSAQQPLT